MGDRVRREGGGVTMQAKSCLELLRSSAVLYSTQKTDSQNEINI